MSILYNQSIPKGIVFSFDALNKKCYSGTGNTFTDLISGVSTTAINTTSLSMDSTLGSPHLQFNPGATTRTAYIPFDSTLLKLPRGTESTISIWSYFQDQGSIDHPMVGWETGSGWDGLNGFVVGTGWGTDGTRFAVAGYNPGYGGMETNKWIHWVVSFKGSASNGLKLYKNASVIVQGTPTTVSIGSSNTLSFNIGATNSRGGNWGGYLDIVQIWERELTSDEISLLYLTQKNRFGL
jgi:hypothetical protein